MVKLSEEHRKWFEDNNNLYYRMMFMGEHKVHGIKFPSNLVEFEIIRFDMLSGPSSKEQLISTFMDEMEIRSARGHNIVFERAKPSFLESDGKIKLRARLITMSFEELQRLMAPTSEPRWLDARDIFNVNDGNKMDKCSKSPAIANEMKGNHP